MESKDCSLSGVKILIIVDEPEVLALTRLMLLQYKAKVFTAPTTLLLQRMSAGTGTQARCYWERHWHASYGWPFMLGMECVGKYPYSAIAYF